MKAVLDACVLFPTILRTILLGVAEAGLYTPLWSSRILEEWARASVKLGPGADTVARGDIALLGVAFPRACVAHSPAIEARLYLPDADDVHVLATAIAGGADAIITFNAADFPRHLLAGEGIARRDPDGFLWEIWSHHPAKVEAVVRQTHAMAERLSGTDIALKAFMRRAQLPRLGKALQP